MDLDVSSSAVRVPVQRAFSIAVFSASSSEMAFSTAANSWRSLKVFLQGLLSGYL